MGKNGKDSERSGKVKSLADYADDEVLSLSEAAPLVGVRYTTLRDAAESGAFACIAYRRGSRVRRATAGELRRFKREGVNTRHGAAAAHNDQAAASTDRSPIASEPHRLGRRS